MLCGVTGELPTGTVTFLFTDVEGSTRLLDEVGDGRYAELLAEHHRVCREAWAAHGGVEVDTAGDAFFVAFARASDALRAAAAAQQALASTPLRVRMGVHTGEVLLGETGYVGLEVHRAARIAAAGHGGQVLVSSSTVAAAGDAAAELTDLGDHRFKDLAAPERVYQLGEDTFAPLESLYHVTLPVPATPFRGRAAELEAVVALLAPDGPWLVTLSGPGGTGKTRLALQAAAEASDGFSDGVFWVGLAALRDPLLVVPQLARAVGVAEQQGRQSLQVLAERLGGKRLLVLLDNAEQLLPDLAAELALLRAAVPTLRLLVTSRERLQLAGERVHPVPSLEEDEAVQLFCERAAGVGPALEPSDAVRELCARLDHLPLALELAAARTVLFTPEQLLERLSQRLDLLEGGRDSDPRQLTLRATIEWSYDLLDEAERRLFGSLSVFAGGCTYEAAEQVCGSDANTLQSLLDKSLVRRHDTDLGARYWMLDTIRELAVEKRLSDADRELTSRRHADWVLEWTSRLDIRGRDQQANLSRLRHELPNVRVALDELGGSECSCDRLRLVTSLAQGMFQLGAAVESRAWFDDVLGASERCPSELRARALAYASMQMTLTGDAETGLRRAIDATELVGQDDPDLIAEVLLAASVAQLGSGNLVAAEQLAAQSLSRAHELDNAPLIGDLRNNLSYLALLNGNLDLARDTAEGALAEARRRADHHLAAVLLHNLFMIALESDAPPDATRHLDEAMEIARRHGFTEVLRYAVEGVAAVAAGEGALDVAATLLGATSSRERSGGELEDRLWRQTTDNVRSSLGEAAFQELTAAGESLGLENAADLAARWITEQELYGAMGTGP